MNTQSSFLSNDVYAACRRARVYYLDTLARKQMHSGTPISSLEASMKHYSANVDTYKEEALRAAFAGDVQTASTQFVCVVTEWSLYKAHHDLIEVMVNKAYLNPADSDTAKDFDRAIEHKIVFWATQLANKWREGDTQRKKDIEALTMQHNTALYGQYQEMGNALNQAHQYNNQYADIALQGARQAMQGVEHIYAEVQSGMKQNLPREMEKAQTQRDRQRFFTKAGCVIVLMLSIPAAFTLAYLLLQVVLH